MFQILCHFFKKMQIDDRGRGGTAEGGQTLHFFDNFS